MKLLLFDQVFVHSHSLYVYISGGNEKKERINSLFKIATLQNVILRIGYILVEMFLSGNLNSQRLISIRNILQCLFLVCMYHMYMWSCVDF